MPIFSVLGERETDPRGVWSAVDAGVGNELDKGERGDVCERSDWGSRDGEEWWLGRSFLRK